MEKEYKFGKMEPDTKENGRITRQRERESFGMLMGIFSRESGLTIK